VTIDPTLTPTAGLDVHIGGVELSNGAGLVFDQLDAPSAADLNNGQYVADNHHANHGVLVLGTYGSAANPVFSVDAISKIDLTDNDLIIHTGSNDTTTAPGTVGNSNATGGYDELLAIEAAVAKGRNGGAWNGTNGLTSSVAQAQDNSDGLESVQLGPVINSDLADPYSAWAVGTSSEPLGANDIIVKYTYTGDFNLDGKVDGNDYNILGLYYDGGATTGNEWAFGSTNGSGLIDGNDYNTFSLDYGNGTANGNDTVLL
jgi:hypothetical protein